MKTNITRVISVLLAFVFICLATGCNSPAAPSESYGDDEVVPIKIFAMEYADPAYARSWDQHGMATVKKIALERYNIDFQLDEVAGDYNSVRAVLNTKFASGVDIPDVIRFDFSKFELNELYSKGHILNLSDFSAKIPNIIESFDQIPSLKLTNCTPEGDILCVPSIAYNVQHVTYWLHIRRDWLDDLNLPMPKTTDEFKNALKAFQKNDMNKNGKKDEVFFPNYEIMNMTLGQAFGALGLSKADSSWYIDDNGKIYNAMLTDQARNYVEYVNSMFSEGLFWADSFSGNASQSLSLVNADCRAGMCGRYWDSLTCNIDGFTRGRPEEYNAMFPLSDGSNPARILVKDYDGFQSVVLTSRCKAPEKVVRFYDWCMTREGTVTTQSGDLPGESPYFTEVLIKDIVDHEIVEALNIGNNEKTEILTEAGEALNEKERNMRASLGVNNGLWPFKMINNAKEIALDHYSAYDREATRSASDLLPAYEKLDWPNGEGHSFTMPPLAVMTDDQAQEYLEFRDLYDYMDQMYHKFMLGLEPLSKWDSFVSTCNSLGLDRLTKLQQTRYDALKLK